MATKEEIEEEINQKLGTDLDWEEMKKDDLEELLHLIESHKLLEGLLKNGAKDMGQKQLAKMVDEWYPGKYAGVVL